MTDQHLPSGENHADLPIEKPAQDMYGIDPFVRSLARSVRGMKSPQGIVIGLNGPWGSGKSSAINLLRHHLSEAVASEDVEVVTFNPWWFRGEEALVLAFFRELYTATKPALGDRAKKSLSKLGARLLKAGSVVAPAADALGASGAGSIAAGAMSWLSDMIEDGESVEDLHKQLSTALAGQAKRFVVIIDDIDRLAPDEALAMFRLVKSVGRLPNVIYILAFDRLLAEKVVAERFPSEGPHYLEKIVQASFELPMPLVEDLHAQIQNLIFNISPPDEESVVHVMNLFHAVLTPEIKTPRDVVRFGNAFTVTWPAVAGDVDLGDFIALEALRLFQPALHKAIRENPSILCGSAQMGYRPQVTGDELDAILLSSVSDKTHYRQALMRLFPKLQSIWANTYHSGGDALKRRRACSSEHFSTYFRFGPTDDIASKTDVTALLGAVTDPDAFKEQLRSALAKHRRNGGTKAAPLLDALSIYSATVPIENVQTLLAALFELGDELDVEADDGKGFSGAGNDLRMHWAMRALLFDRTTLKQRSAILLHAAKSASLSWLSSLAVSAWDDYHPPEGREPEPEEKCLTTGKDADKLAKMAVTAIEKAAASGALIEHRNLARLLYIWRDFKQDEGKAVLAWTAQQLTRDYAVACFARAFTRYSWGQSMGMAGLGDMVAKRTDRASVETIHTLLDRDSFRARLESLEENGVANENDADAIKRFLRAWRHRDEHGD